MDHLRGVTNADVYAIEIRDRESEESRTVLLYSATPTGADIAAAAGFPIRVMCW